MREAEITALVEKPAAVHGLEVDRVEILPAGKRKLLRVYLDGDGPAGLGPTLDQIAAATRAISISLDSSDAVGQQPYTLEVSSRGVTRPLTQPKHFRRNTGRLVALTLREGAPVTGRITHAGEAGVDLDVDDRSVSVGYQQIAKAVVQVELNRVPAEDEEE